MTRFQRERKMIASRRTGGTTQKAQASSKKPNIITPTPPAQKDNLQITTAPHNTQQQNTKEVVSFERELF